MGWRLKSDFILFRRPSKAGVGMRKVFRRPLAESRFKRKMVLDSRSRILTNRWNPRMKSTPSRKQTFSLHLQDFSERFVNSTFVNLPKQRKRKVPYEKRSALNSNHANFSTVSVDEKNPEAEEKLSSAKSSEKSASNLSPGKLQFIFQMTVPNKNPRKEPLQR
ncbi:unnamed protein product [Larinioides sclopetarius]|uniref:Uncharacterized protein n=1 Tax=Larinioides sclopetarius TaxID=280406 RepID=A0AAV1ZR26_9ARAC